MKGDPLRPGDAEFGWDDVSTVLHLASAEEPAANSESWRKWMRAAASASSLRHSAARSARHQQGKSWICSLYRAPISMTGGQRSVIKDSAVNSLMEMLGFVWQRCWALLARRTTAKAEHAPPSANAQ